MFRSLTIRNIKSIHARLYSTPPSTTKGPVPIPGMGDYEIKIFNMLKTALKPDSLSVRDISGGCGSMFAISIDSEKFSGLNMIKQHRLVNEILKDEISKWHGLQLKTKVVKK